METVSQTRSHGGTQGVYKHTSSATGTEMTFAVFNDYFCTQLLFEDVAFCHRHVRVIV